VKRLPALDYRAGLRRLNPSLWAKLAATFTFGCLLLLAPRATGQASAGITGTVTDSSGAVISGANVSITNQATSVTTHTVTGSAGNYTVRGLIPGRYDVVVEAPGFKKAVRNDVTVEVSTTATIDVEVATGAATETVQVTADQIALNTTQPELGSTIEPVVVAALPVEVSGRGRQVDALQFMAPGTTGSTFSHRVSGGVDFEQEIVYNGIPAPQPETEGYTTNFNPPFELVQEYRVERSTFSAQFGLGQGALTYQMKSGGNKYHGDLFEINRNSFFDSVGFFNGPAFDKSNVHNKPPTDHENNYGFAIGGPIWIPHVYDGHNKTFGFYTQEWYKQNNEDTDVSTVPTAIEKTGDFSDFVDGSSGTLIPIYDPLTGQQFQCNGVLNVICPNRISALSATLIPSIPSPDRPGSGVGGLDSNKSFAPFINPHIQHVWGFTVDHSLTPTQTIHYSQWRNSFSNYSFDNHPLVVQPNPLNSMKFDPALGTVFLLNYSNTVSSHLVATAGIGWIGELNNQFNQTNYNFPAVNGGTIPPNITFDGNHTPTSWGTTGAWLRSINRKLGVAVVNNWLWMKGRNTFNIGAEFRRSYQDDNEEQTEGGHFSFSQRTTSVHDSSDPNFGKDGSAFASFLLGVPDAANRSNSQELRLRNWDLSPYLQDDIKLSPKFTLNLGLRWDIQAPFTENNNLIVFFNQDKPGAFPGSTLPGSATKFGNCTGCAGFNRADIHLGHFGPRLGFAYQLNNKTVIQGGLDVAFLNGGAYEYGTAKVAVNYSNLLTGSFTRASTGSYTSSFGSWDTNAIPPTVPTPFSPGLGAGNQINAFSKKDGYAPYTEQWNLNVQRELPYNMMMTAAFVGNRIIHLPSQLNEINQLDPQFLSLGSKLADTFAPGQTSVDGVALPYNNFVNDFGGSATVAQALVPYPQYSKIFNNFEASGTTYYQGGQIEVDKRFSNGLSFLAGYTLSHLMDNTSSGFSSFTAGGINKFNQKPEWTVSSSDESQTFKATGTYELPIGPGKKYLNNHTTGNILGGWQVGWILDYEAGSPISGCQLSSVCENGTPFPNGFNRPDRNPSVSLSTASYSKARDYFTGKSTVAQMFNPAGFTPTATQYVLGDAKRIYGELKNPPLYNESLNARKHFYMGDRFQAILTVDYFNAFNRTRFNGPDGNINDGTFGQVKDQGLNNISNRQGQVSFRVEF
jgi:hypothetical protein